MIPRSLLFLVGVASIATLAPAIVGAVRMRELDRAWRWVVAWCCASAVISLVMSLLGSQSIPNASFAHLTLLPFGVLGLLAFGALAHDHGRLRSILRLAAAAFALAWGVVTIRDGIPTLYSTVAQPLMDLLLLFAAAGLLVMRLGQLEARPLRDPVVLVCLGALVIYAPSVASYPVAAVIDLTDRATAVVIFSVRAGLGIVGIILYTLALLWTPPRPSLSGS